MIAVVYEAVDWAIIQTYEGEPYADYRNCDVCFESVLTDIWAGLPESQWRTFTRQHGGNADGCNVCSHCIDVFLMEE